MANGFETKDFQSNFDAKAFVFKVIGYWKLFVISILIGVGIAYYINVRKPNVYQLSSLVSVENEQNPFFTSNTSISFNWGGVTGKVQTVMTTLKTRSHNEKVIDSLEFYMSFLKQGEYNMQDVYTNAPFQVDLQTNKGQVLGIPLKVTFTGVETFKLSAEFETNTVTLQNYDSKEKSRIQVNIGLFEKEYAFGDQISLPFFSGSIEKREGRQAKVGEEYFIKFSNFDGVVNQYKNGLDVKAFAEGSSVLTLALRGGSKAKIVDFLNATTDVLRKNELERKNQYATNTIKFIDSTLASMVGDLKLYESELKAFRTNNNFYNIDEGALGVSERLRDNEAKIEQAKLNIEYLDDLEEYLNTKTDYSNIAAPTSLGMIESNIQAIIGRITALSVERQNLEYTTKEGSALFKDLDRRITAEKNVLLETVDATRISLTRQLTGFNSLTASLEAELRKLPEDQQAYLKIQRKFDISQQMYNVFQSKRAEAAVVKAANVSDITVIDEAKDIGGGKVGPNTQVNYLMALLVGFAIPFVLVFVMVFMDNNIHTISEIEKLSSIPVLGVIGRYKSEGNLAVIDYPKSAIAEGFRVVRSALQYFYKSNQIDGTKTVLLTSSISGEGKTFCSINVASVFALTDKRTVLVGLDLRKPKIFGDFDINNDVGVVNYLIGEKPLAEVIQPTQIPNLDVITSGLVPPNPSELLMSEKMHDFMAELKSQYDMVVLDSPPLGLVTDAFELVQYADATVYMVRQNFTKKDMLGVIDAKYKRGEIKNISLLLNCYTHRKNQGYGYGYGYGYDYGYHENEKPKFSVKEFIKRLFK
ncbi:MAG: sugar transporter [Bacteroidetes bacterium MedPE-SWsnd-G2]|nr:MAG: sugar transporter [Bacteroidetes bacterium MedPE-SWsnd-G2]